MTRSSSGWATRRKPPVKRIVRKISALTGAPSPNEYEIRNATAPTTVKTSSCTAGNLSQRVAAARDELLDLGGGTLGVARFGGNPHEPAADDDAISDLTYGGSLFRRPDAEADRDRNVGFIPQGADEGLQLSRQLASLAGHADERDGIDEAAGRCRDSAPALLGRGERDQRHE